MRYLGLLGYEEGVWRKRERIVKAEREMEEIMRDTKASRTESGGFASSSQDERTTCYWTVHDRILQEAAAESSSKEESGAFDDTNPETSSAQSQTLPPQ